MITTPISKAPTAHLKPRVTPSQVTPIVPVIRTPDPKELTATSQVNNVLHTAQTRKGIYDYLQRDGLFATDPGMTPAKWAGLAPEETLKFMSAADPNKYGVAYGKTANPGGIQYITKDLIPAGNRVTKRASFKEVPLSTSGGLTSSTTKGLMK